MHLIPNIIEERLLTAQAFVFDMDGVIVDAEGLWSSIKHKTAKHFDLAVDDEFIGRYRGHGLRRFANLLLLANGKSASESKLDAFEQFADELAFEFYEFRAEPIPGVLEFLSHIKSSGVKLGLCSNCPEKFIWPLIVRLGIEEIFDSVVSTHTLSTPKPSSNGYIEVCRNLGVAPSSSVAFEDTISGGWAARSAEMICIGIDRYGSLSGRTPFHLIVPNFTTLSAIMGIEAISSSSVGNLSSNQLVLENAHPLSEQFFLSMYSSFDQYISEEATPERIEERGLNHLTARDERLRYSGYFKPYFRCSRGGSFKDYKYVLQTNSSFVDELMMEHEDNFCLVGPYLKTLLALAPQIFSPALEYIRQNSLDAFNSLYDELGRRSFAARIIKYQGDSLAGTNFHVDKSALSCILHASDWGNRSRLVFASIDSGVMSLGTSPGRGVTFFGAALAECGYCEFPALMHAVRSIGEGQVRFSTVLFCLQPGVDLSTFSTKVQLDDMLTERRDY